MFSIDREPAVAGSFYNSDPKELTEQLQNCFKNLNNAPCHNIAALVVPHAGYVYSGKVSASAYNLLPHDVEFDNIFIIGSSHHVAVNGASVYNLGHYRTPLGIVPVNLKIANELIKNNPNIIFNKTAHAEEHTIEVQLPFLQHKIKHINAIIPVIIGVRDYELCKTIAKALKPYFNSNNLFIFSTDFSHYPCDADARLVDSLTADAICSNSPDKFIASLNQNKNKNTPNLVTSTCGWSSILTLMYLTHQQDNYAYSKIKYMTSGEVAAHNTQRVVGYQSVLIKRDSTTFLLTNKQKENLLKTAHDSITKHLEQHKKHKLENYQIDFAPFNSAFVSVYVGGDLRGCIGQFDSPLNLNILISTLSKSAAFNDDRFNPIQQDEIPDLRIEISVLTPLKKIINIDEIELGKHGVFLKKGDHKGTFLPQVATKTGWDKEEFLGHLSRNKAHLGWESWYDAELYIFEAIIFSD